MVQNKGTQIGVSECRQGFTLTQNMIFFLLCPTPPTYATVNQPNYAEMFSHGVIPSKEAGNNPGLYPVKGQ